jgi:hypothetical protein
VLVCGVDVGNSTTEVAFAQVEPGREPEFLLVLRCPTSGPKGSRACAAGVRGLVSRGARRVGADPHLLLLAEIHPVESTLVDETQTSDVDLGRTAIARPASDTPSGVGVGVGRLVLLAALYGQPASDPVIPIVLAEPFDAAASALRDARTRGWRIAALIVRGDDAVLIGNRFDTALPIADEVADAETLPVGETAAVEVAEAGASVREVADPLRLATLLGLDAQEARAARNAARLVTGHRAAIVIRMPPRPHPAVDAPQTPAGEADDAVIDRLVVELPVSREDPLLRLRLRQRRVRGVATLRGRDDDGLVDELAVTHQVRVVGSEPDAAMLGAATTPGAGTTPFVIDIGGGTVDLHRAGAAVVRAGAGELVTRIVAALLDSDAAIAERAKRRRSVRVETPFVLHHEDSSRSFLGEPAVPYAVGRLCVDEPDGLLVLRAAIAPEVWRVLRRQAKRDVIGRNVRRAVDASGGVPAGELVCLVGGCAADAEVVEEVAAELADLDVAVARGDVLGRHGPRGAVAVGLVRAFTQGGR